jgi:hypothetical protein
MDLLGGFHEANSLEAERTHEKIAIASESMSRCCSDRIDDAGN